MARLVAKAPCRQSHPCRLSQRTASPAVRHPPSSPLRHCRPHSIVLRDEGGVTLPREPVVVVRVGGVDADPESTGREKRSVLGHVHRPLLPVHHDRVAKLYAVELRVGDGVREKSGRGGVAHSMPNGRRPACEDGEAHAWLGPAALLGPASPDLRWNVQINFVNS